MKYRTIFISDIHLGSRGCDSFSILSFLKKTDCDILYLVGDIIDLWVMRKNWYWPQDHNNIVQLILKKAKNGTKVVYIPGNHDEIFKDFCGYKFGDIEIARNSIHRTLENKKFFITHGDDFDVVMKHQKWLALFGSFAYEYLIKFNNLYNFIRRKLGLEYWSLSAYVKHKIKNVTVFISNYEKFLVDISKNHNVDGIICGHIHKPDYRIIDGIEYYNTGDWIENNTALVEKENGKLEIIYFDRNQEEEN